MFSACLEFYYELTLERPFQQIPVKAITTIKHRITLYFIMQIDINSDILNT